jgi:DNA-binding MarR family transcriptional regulator
MTQSTIIEALQNGPLTSEELCRLTGLPKSAVLSAAKKLRYKGELITEEVKVGRYWMAKYTLVESLVKPKDEARCLLNPFDIRNAKGIFSKSEYAVMNAQAKRLLGRPKPAKEITNNQFI